MGGAATFKTGVSSASKGVLVSQLAGIGTINYTLSNSTSSSGQSTVSEANNNSSTSFTNSRGGNDSCNASNSGGDKKLNGSCLSKEDDHDLGPPPVKKISLKDIPS